MKTRRQQKHELLLTFIANTNVKKQERKRSSGRPRILRTLLSLFI